MASITAIDRPNPAARSSGAAMRLITAALVLVTWISAAVFGLYIAAHYGGAVADGTMDRWNSSLPRLFEAGSPAATSVIGLHFAAGAVLLVLGPIQLIGAIRRKAPAVHHWLGRVYIGSAFAAGVGGLGYIFIKGTVGGPAMNIGFGLYGALMILASVQTLRHAMARRLDLHRAWAIRLFALAIGSWLYRIDYGFWYLLAGAAGHTKSFDGWFDAVMDFFFFIPNLMVAELVIRANLARAGAGLRYAAIGALTASTALVSLGSYFFIVYAWGPEILARFVARG
ncbi:DUF2306 domain-containing protein [soil metagenome]